MLALAVNRETPEGEENDFWLSIMGMKQKPSYSRLNWNWITFWKMKGVHNMTHNNFKLGFWSFDEFDINKNISMARFLEYPGN